MAEIRSRQTYAAVTAKISDRFASVMDRRQTLVNTLNAAMTQSLDLSDCILTKTQIDAMGSKEARIHVIQDVTLKTVAS